MEEKFKYSFDESTRILYNYYYGQITIDDIYSSWEYVISKHLIPEKTKGFIVDYRKATFNVKVREYSKISDYYKNHLDVFRNYKIAMITQNPKDIIVPLLVESKDEGYFTKTFFTEEAAVEWILG